MDAWFDVTAGMVLPLAILSFLERRGREQLAVRQQREDVHWMALAEDPRCPPRLEPGLVLLFSSVAFSAASLAAPLLLPAQGHS